jgi:hypothetical protein
MFTEQTSERGRNCFREEGFPDALGKAALVRMGRLRGPQPAPARGTLARTAALRPHSAACRDGKRPVSSPSASVAEIVVRTISSVSCAGQGRPRCMVGAVVPHDDVTITPDVKSFLCSDKLGTRITPAAKRVLQECQGKWPDQPVTTENHIRVTWPGILA